MSTRYLLDTSAASYTITKKSPAFDRHLVRVAMGELRASTAIEGQLRYGLARRRSGPLQATIETFLLGLTICPWDSSAAQNYGNLRAALERLGQLLASLDMMIAAHALSLGLDMSMGCMREGVGRLELHILVQYCRIA